MLADKYLNKTKFDSYDDFIKNYKINIPEDFNFGFDIVDVYANENPDKKALVWCNDYGEEKIFSFAEIKKYSNKIANLLVKTGIKKGDKILLILKQRYEYWLTAVALHKIGAVLIPGSVQLTKKDIIYRTNAANIKMIIATGEKYVVEQVESAMAESPTVIAKAIVKANGVPDTDNTDIKKTGWIDFAEEYGKEPDIFERTDVKAADVMLMYFTSGTTGMPKMVVHDNSYPIGHITTAKYWQQVCDNTLHFSYSDSGWAKFGWGKIYGQWISGAAILAYDWDKFAPDKLLKVIEKYKVTTFCVPPTMYRFIIKEDLSKYDFSGLKHASTAGEPLNPEVFNQFLKATGLKIYEGFGMSETSVFLGNFEWFEPKPGSTGKPSPLYDIDLINDEGKSCTDGEEGEIVIKNLDKYHPVGLMTGYYQDGEIIKDCFEGGLYRPGDVAWRDTSGYYWFVGRKDDMIKCSGYRIGPFEVESAVVEHPAVLECAITAAPDPIRGQVVKATVVLIKDAKEKGYEPSEELIKDIQNHVKTTTAPYKYPRVIEFVDELPKTLGGKIKRAEIRKESEGKFNQ
ncbi:MAG: AMP-binding protein [Oscillospiraceae bacterium]|nr:AMP-binding protein [Oscillospiraceae bacterium]